MSTQTLVPPPPRAQGLPVLKETAVGNYFVANYPPFGFWRTDAVADLDSVLDLPPRPDTGLGLYTHIPFCRKRCHFCYFRVYTDKNSRDIAGYIDSVLAELDSYATRPALEGRTPDFIYFGGGTPSYLSVEQFRTLTAGMQARQSWANAREITVECEPGTLNESKLKAYRDLGVTRLSLGIEHFDEHILTVNGRAHRAKEIDRAYSIARSLNFPDINVDLIAGMVEETEEKWHAAVEKCISLAPDAVTIYQMEVPYNTEIYRRMKAEGQLTAPVADWDTKRRWVSQAFDQFIAAGYSVATATTVVKNPARPFLYRNGLFDGTDILSLGVSSFGHLSGVNYQNLHDFDPYIAALAAGRPAVYRAYPLTRDEQYIREFALQMKGGSVDAAKFTKKFGVDPRVQFAGPLAIIRDRGFLTDDGTRIGVNRAGLLQVDRLLYEFFRPEHQNGRYA